MRLSEGTATSSPPSIFDRVVKNHNADKYCNRFRH